MKIPRIRGMIDRRILVNFRIDHDVLAKLLPQPFRPQVVHGHGMAGICLIRLKHVRPRGLPGFCGIASENAAHRIAVEWDDEGQTRTGVFIPRRDTSSMLNHLAGGRIFPGVHHRASFDVQEKDGRMRVVMDSDDHSTHVLVDGCEAADLNANSTFESLGSASQFFQRGSLGYSPRFRRLGYDGIELRSFDWQVRPLDVHNVESSFFDDRKLFPAGSVTFDSALLMRNIDHEWLSKPSLG